MNSFYGGKEGRTYNIIHTYKSIEEMVRNFALGAAYPEVSYGQYVMIDTDSKNNPDNGRLYRRGINYSQELENSTPEHPGAGAIYIGQIVGPDGKVPKLSFVDISYIENHESEEKDIILFDEDRKDAVELDENNQIQENPIKIGYVNEFNEEEGKYAGKIGIDIPKTVFKIDAEIIPASQDLSQEINHYDIAYNNDAYSIDFSNPLHQHNSSTKAVENGVEYYDYKLIVPTPSNFNIVNNNTSYDSQGHLITPSTYQLVYDTVENNQKITKTINTDIELPVRLDFDDSTGDLITYTTNKGNIVTLGNPNGQFHLYAWLKTDDEGNSFTSVQDVINYLNNSDRYKYGIRVPFTDGNNNKIYDLTQAGWLIAADIKTQGAGEVAKVGYATVGESVVADYDDIDEQVVSTEKTCLFAFDYITEDGEQYNLNNLTTDPDPAVAFKGWFLVQDFNSSLASDPVQIILVGSQNIDVTESDIMELKDKGVWLYGQESEAKWW